MTEAERQAIEFACARVSMALGMAADRHDADAYAGFYTVDGEFDRRGEVIKGRAAIAATIKAWPADFVIRHFSGPIVIDVQDANNATGVTYFTSYQHRGPLNDKGVAPMKDPQAFAEYRDRFVRTPEGWRIAYRKTVPVFAR